MPSAIAMTRRALPVKSMSFLTYARASAPSAGDERAFSPRQVRARISTSACGASGMRLPSGSTSVTGRLRPP